MTDISSEDAYELLKYVYNKYDKDGRGVTLRQTVKMLVRMSKHIPVLKKIEFEETLAAFALFDKDGDGRLSFDEVREWWKTRDKYEYLVGEKAKIIKRAYQLYSNYTSSTRMTPGEFFKFLDENEIEYNEYSFEAITRNKQLTFNEFVDWLNWL